MKGLLRKKRKPLSKYVKIQKKTSAVGCLKTTNHLKPKLNQTTNHLKPK